MAISHQANVQMFMLKDEVRGVATGTTQAWILSSG